MGRDGGSMNVFDDWAAHVQAHKDVMDQQSGKGLGPVQRASLRLLGQANQANAGSAMQDFTTGATRSADGDKNEYDGFLSVPVLEEFGDYMTRHRFQADGKVRAADNWQKGIPLASYMKSFVRHALELWGLHRGHISRRLAAEYPGKDTNFLLREASCAVFFNIQGFLHETLKAQRADETKRVIFDADAASAQEARKRAWDEEVGKLWPRWSVRR